MKDLIYSYLAGQSVIISFQQMFFNMAVALFIGVIIFVAYRFSYSGTVYSTRFNISLVMLTLITTTVMTVIGNNIALSLGMVGALSIVRFRTAVKDPRDTVFIFWAITVGICCGTASFLIAGIGSSFLFLFLIVAGRIRAENRYILVIRGNKNLETEIEAIVFQYYKNINLRVKNTTEESVEFIYELSSKTILKTQETQDMPITDKLYGLKKIDYVNLICQNDEINR